MAKNLWLQRPSALPRQPSSSLLIHSIGGKGTQLGEFDNCNSITTLSNRNIAVADTNNSRIQILTPTGVPIKSIGKNKLHCPWGVTAMPFGKFCVSEGSKRRIVVYTDDGEFVSKFQLNDIIEPCALATCPTTGNIIITDNQDTHVYVYDFDGTLITFFKPNPDMITNEVPTTEHVAVDKEGNIFLSFVCGYSEIQVFDQLGDFKFKFGNFTSACGIHITLKGNVLVTEREERTVNMYSSNGQFIQQLLAPALGIQGYPHSVTVVSGNVVVVTGADDMYGCPTWVNFYRIS